jgi:hypothetical protein
VKETPGVVRLEKNTLPVVVLGVLCDFFFCSSSFAFLRDMVSLPPPTGSEADI